MNTTFRNQVFYIAHELVRATGAPFAICLSKAWILYRLKKQMHDGIVHFAYMRRDGSLRRARGTLKNVEKLIKGTGAENYKTVRYFDLGANSFRCFRVENFITSY